MLRNGRELLAPGNIDCEPCIDREADMGRLGEVLCEGKLDMTGAFIGTASDKDKPRKARKQKEDSQTQLAAFVAGLGTPNQVRPHVDGIY
jgi:hypothetical protein